MSQAHVVRILRLGEMRTRWVRSVRERGPRSPSGIVACIEGLAADAGAEVLRRGGNAADAAIATAFAQAVVNPVHCGIAGSFHGLFWNGHTREAAVVSAGGYAPTAARPDNAQSLVLGYRASTVHGFIRGAADAHSRYGSGLVTWRELLAPAITLAAEGFEVYPYLYRLWMPTSEYGHGFLEGEGPRILGFTEASRRIYLHPDGSVLRIGERLVQQDYAKTLMRIADQGPDEFYEGETARKMGADFERHNGFLSEEDLREFRSSVTEPVKGTFREYEILSEPGPSVGPVVLELLNVLEGWDLIPLGWNTPAYLDRLARAMYAAFHDRATLLGDPDFVDVQMDRMISKEHAALVRSRIESGGRAVAPPRSLTAGREGTTHVTVVDGDRSGAAITHSIGSASGVVTPGLGFLHNSHMAMFDPTPGSRNAVEPKKRPLTGGAPVLFLRDGRLNLLIGSPAGARKVSAVVQAFLNGALFSMPLGQAVAVDRIHVDSDPPTLIVEPYFSPDTIRDLARLGHRIRFEWYTARLAAVADDPRLALVGASDPRGDRGLVTVP